MSAENFESFMSLVWPADGDFDSPLQGLHITKGDAGGLTFGGVIDATWKACVARGIISGELRDATIVQLRAVLYNEVWGSVCDDLPSGLDLLVANGRMMTGRYPHLLQQCLGFYGSALDGIIGPDTLGVASSRDTVTLIHALTGTHDAYLRGLATWGEFGVGWERRLQAARFAALELVPLV